MDTSGKPQVIYREVQHFSQWWIWGIVLGIAALQWWACYEQFYMRRPFGDNPAPDWMLIVFFLLFGIGMPGLFIAAKLITEVRADGVCLRFIPFHLRAVCIPFTDIASFSAGIYSPLVDYGGWGIRYGKNGRAYNVNGNMGVRLELASGQHLLIGSARAIELASAIETAVRVAKSDR